MRASGQRTETNSRPPGWSTLPLELGQVARGARGLIQGRRQQELLLPPSLREWLAEDHLAWFVLDAVEVIDLRV
jgi:hypothetical protein